jgi:hypothetical protein
VDDKFIKKVLKCGVVENVMDWAKLKQVRASASTSQV